ncbi:MAG: response regulator [Planctomycetota bacterium]
MPPNAKGKNSTTQQSRPNSVGLNSGALDRLLDQLDQPGDESHPRREFVRRAFRRQTVLLRIAQISGAEVTLRVACRNLSRGGMAILHNAYLHPGSRCAIALPHPVHRFVKIAGTVVRSTHRTGTIHEVGIQFDRPVDPKEFLGPDEGADEYSLEHVDTEKLIGCIMHLDDSELDRRIVQHYLRDTQLRIRPASTVEEAVEIATEGVDLILSDYHLEDENSERLIEELKAKGCSTPVIMVSGDSSAPVQKRIESLDIAGFVTKPFEQQLLLRVLGEFLLVRASGSTNKSTLDPSDPNYKLIEAFVTDLHRFAERIDKTVARGDADGCRSICLQIANAAPMMGFAALAKLAEKAAQAIAANGSVRDAVAEVHALSSACSRASR